MKLLQLIIICCVLFVSSACRPITTYIPVSQPHTVATREPLKLTIDQTAAGLHFTVSCVNTLAFKDVKATFQINGVNTTFSYGQPFGQDPSAVPPACTDGKLILEGNLGQIQQSTGVIISFAVLYPDGTYQSVQDVYRMEPDGRIYPMR
jgi:hypothetical protein